MKLHQNPILTGVTSRVRQLLEQYAESKSIQHSGTKGSLREAYLRQFLANFISHPFVAKPGFITDCGGNQISPQLDLIIFNQSTLTDFALSDFVTVVPIESVRLVIEVKSILKASDFDQITAQQTAFRQMRFAWTTLDRKFLHTVDCLRIPQLIVAFDSTCSEETIRNWFEQEAGLESVCIVGKFTAIRTPTHGNEILSASKSHVEILHLVSFMTTLIRCIEIELSSPLLINNACGQFKLYPDIGAYLTFDTPDQ